MQDLTVKSHNLSFGCGLTKEKKIAAKILRKFANRVYQSDTLLDEMHFKSKNFRNEYKRRRAAIKIAEFALKINIYREMLYNHFPFKSAKDLWKLEKRVIDAAGLCNCSECASVMLAELRKAGLNARMISDKNIDHAFVVVNAESKIKNYKTKGKNIFVVDAWLKKIYKSFEEAYVDYKIKFKASKKTRLQDDSFYFYDNLPSESDQSPQTRIVVNFLMHELRQHMKRIQKIAQQEIDSLPKEKLEKRLPAKKRPTVNMYYRRLKEVYENKKPQ